MSRKQSAVERIRKKASASGKARGDTSGDPYHNGETPSCQILVEAVQDIFPELHSEKRNRVPSSEFGQLLRWQVLKRRKERAFPPAPPLTSPDEPKTTTQDDGIKDDTVVPSLPSKKKRKKKKKKKESDMGQANGEARALDIETPQVGDGLLSGTIIEQTTTAFEAPSLDCDEDSSDEVEIVPLKEDDGPSKPRVPFDPSLDALDRSLHEMEEERSRYEEESTPDLLALPSDGTDMMDRGFDSKSHCSALSFDEIPQESTERDEEDAIEMLVPINLEPTSTLTRPGRPKLRSRTLSSSSFESFQSKLSTASGPDSDDSDDNDNENQGCPASPTHEWVPEEEPEAKNETPPGDTIKDPLNLPYLLTLNSENGLTTTTINGKLIYAEKANLNIEDYQLGSLEATKVLLEDWLGQVVTHRMKRGKNLSSPDAESDIADFLRQLHQFLKDGSQPEGIPFHEYRELSEKVECQACRQGVSELVDEWSRRPPDKCLVLNPKILEEIPTNGDTNLDTAFDYVALEEGHHFPQPDPPAEEDGLDVDRDAHMSFYMGTREEGSRTEKVIFIDRLNHTHLNNLIENWLPSGIEEEDLVNTSINDQMSLDGSNAATVPEILDTEEAKRIERRILSRIQMAQGKLQATRAEAMELSRVLESLLSENGTAQNVHITAFSKMKAVDEKVTAFKVQINVILKYFSDGAECAGENLKLRLWTTYLEALNKVLKVCGRYYEQLAEIADQRGKLPSAFISAPFRELFQNLVKEKVEIWTDFVDSVCELYSGAALQEYITRTVWHTERHSASHQRSGAAMVLDKMCNSLANQLLTWTDTIGSSRMGDIFQGRMRQTEEVLESLQAIVEPLSDEYATVERYFSTERNVYFASLRSNIVLAQGVKKRMRLIDNAEVEGMVTGVLLMWTHVRLMQNRVIYSAGIPPLPLQLKRFMLQDARSMYDSLGMTDATRVFSHHQQHCHLKLKSKRKALCILAGLVYRWLKKKYDLWRAEKAEQELLEGFDIGGASTKAVCVPNTGQVKPKKSKKKKTRKPSSSSNLRSGEVPEEGEAEVKIISDIVPGLDNPNENPDKDDKQAVGTAIVLEPASADNRTEVDNAHCDAVDNYVPIDGVDGGDQSPGQMTHIPDALSVAAVADSIHAMRVFIEDASFKKVAAEDFLVARLRQVRLDATKKANNIVVIS